MGAAGFMVGMQAAQAILGGFGQAAEARRQKAAFQQQEFQRHLNLDVQNRNIATQNALRIVGNQRIERAAIENLINTRVQLEQATQGQLKNLSYASQLSAAALSASASKGNIALNSGTMKALTRQNILRASNSAAQIRSDMSVADKNLQNQYKNALAQRSFDVQEQQAFIPGVNPAGSPGAAIAGGFLSAAAGIAGFNFGGSSTTKKEG